MNWIKILAINISLIFSLLFLLIISPPIIFGIWKIFLNDNLTQSFNDKRSDVHLYSEHNWAKKHFEELSIIPVKYYDFITWRRDDFNGETINIKNGNRITLEANIKSSNQEVLFFGGSTTWGTGVNDENTFPSLFSKEYHIKSFNFGEDGYSARQSLAYLQNLLIQKKINGSNKKSTVVFYDGVNDIASLCRSEVLGLNTVYEEKIRNTLEKEKVINLWMPGDRDNKWSFKRTFSQLIDMFQVVKRKLKPSINTSKNKKAELYYSCADDKNRAHYVARVLVETWKQAAQLSEANNLEFFAILQPVSYIGTPNIDYLNILKEGVSDRSIQEMSNQYKTVYPLIRSYALDSKINFIDLSRTYDGCNDCYIDFCHVGPQAHEILVKQMGFLVKNM